MVHFGARTAAVVAFSVACLIGSAAGAAEPWRDPAVAVLAKGADTRLVRAQQRKKAAYAQVEAAERAIARAQQAIALETERAAAYEAQMPALEADAEAATAESERKKEARLAALVAERAARKVGGAEANRARAALEAAELAWKEARQIAWRARAALGGARRGREAALARKVAAERRLAYAEGQLAAAIAFRTHAVREREDAEHWVAATQALLARDHERALEAEARLGTTEEARHLAERAYLRCVARDGLEPARVAACEAALAQRPSAQRHLALAYLHAGQTEAGLERLGAWPIPDDDAELRSAIGIALVGADRSAEALVHLEAALAHDARDTAALDALARVFVAQGRHANALSALDRIAALDPAYPGLSYRRALVHAALGEDDRAAMLMAGFVGALHRGARDPTYAQCQRDLYRELAPIDLASLSPTPDKASAYLFLGREALARGEIAAAEESFAAALEHAPERPEVRLGVGLFRLYAGDLEGAAAHLSEVVARVPDARARVGLGVALSRLGRQREAIAHLEQAPATDAHARLALGVALARAGERERARGELERATAMAEVADDAQHDLAVLALYAGDSGAAARALAEIPATSPEGHLLRGLVALEVDDVTAAIRHLDRAVAAQPGYLQAQLALGRARDRAGQLELAEAAARRAVGIDPRCPEAHLQLGAILSRRGEGEAAAAEYRKAESLREARRKDLAARDDEEAPPGEPAPTRKGPRRVAVVHFINSRGDARWEWLSFGIAEALSTDLAQLSRLEVIERGQVAALMREIKFASMDFVDAKTAPRIGEVLGAEALVVGSYQVDAERVRIDGRLVELGTQRVLQSGRVEGPIDDLFALERSLALALVGDWVRVDGAERTALVGAPAGEIGGLEQLALTRVKMLAGDQLGAQRAYRAALERSPELARRIQDMRSAYEEAEARVAVLPFKNASDDPEVEWLGVGIAESLGTDLRKIGLYVVERAEVAKVVTEQKFGQLVEPDRAARVGNMVGAQVILLGSYQSMGDLLAIDARMVQVATGAVVLTERVSGKTKDFFALQRQLSAAIAKALDLQVGVEELAALVGDAPELDDFKDTILKDRLFVLRQPTRDAGGGGSLTAPVIVGLSGLAAGVAGGILYGLAEGRHDASQRELALYRAAVDPGELDRRYARSRSLAEDGDTLRIGAYVGFGVAGLAAIYTTWALVDAASDERTTGERVDVVTPRIAPALAPGGVGLDLRLDF